MRTILQRVRSASVRVEGETVGRIGHGLLALVGVEVGDEERDADETARKIAGLRTFEDGSGRTNLDLESVGGAVLVVSQFTLAASLRRGRRPSFDRAEDPDRARRLVDRVADRLREGGIGVETGRFGAHMEVELLNDGPVTWILEVREGRVRDPGR